MKVLNLRTATGLAMQQGRYEQGKAMHKEIEQIKEKIDLFRKFI
ncbi:hypothetical protein Bbad01_37250 [Bacillus badius]|nr:hypothetical protein Bbad01_37250 [Bacillus badius]